MTQCKKCRAYVWIQERLRSRGSKTSPIFSICCLDGRIEIPSIKPHPRLLELISGDSNESKHFRANIRKYNSALSFTSMGAKVDDSLANNNHGVYTYRIHGAVTHRIGTLLPEEGKTPKFAQIYIYDPQEQLEYRNGTNGVFQGDLDNDILLELQTILEEINPLCRSYKTIRQRENGHDIKELKIVLTSLKNRNRRPNHQYSLPTFAEVAVLVPGDTDYSDKARDIIIQGHDGRLQRVYEGSEDYDSLQYVLLHPRGERGWAFRTYEKRRAGISAAGGRQGTPEKFLTVSDFYSYRLQIRSISDSDTRCYLWMFGRLIHQYVVDQYAKEEWNRLEYLRINQDRFRMHSLNGIVDAIAEELSAPNVGKMTVLPSSFNGGRRNLQQRFQDAMSIVRRFGKPTLFITFTCNPKWREIQEALLDGQSAADRPDLVVRSFKIRLDSLLNDLTVENVLGKVVAYTYVVEFQKRGLPHAHILLIIDDKDKPRTPKDYDRLVSAEIPDPIASPLTYQTVVESMIHGPCGDQNPNSPCMINGECSKRYPRKFTTETTHDSFGYPIYRRRPGACAIIERGKGRIAVDNNWVVPYNPWLTTKYDAHINVEICSSISAIKYLYKYVYKGHDRTRMAVSTDGDYDEIQEYLDARYVSACESLWRLFQFPLFGQSHAVYRMPVHLEGEQWIAFRENDSLNDVASKNSTTQLMAWFQLNQTDPNARKFTYPEIPLHYTWNKSSRIWAPRKKMTKPIVPRMYFVHPKQQERFCLRLLLLHVKGAESFRSLRTVNGITYSTFREAALARNLLENDNEWRECLNEASHDRFPGSLRHVFALILAHCNPSDPLELWNEFADALSEDFLFRLNREGDSDVDNADRSRMLALSDIGKMMEGMGSRLMGCVGLYRIYESYLNRFDQESHISVPSEKEDLHQLACEAHANVKLLNQDQCFAFNAISDALQGKSQDRLFFIDGPGGTGKSFLFNTLIAFVKGHLRMKVIVVASSGIASLILRGGQTAHTAFKIPIPITPESTCNLSLNEFKAKMIQQSDLIIWDEAPMQHRHIFEAVHRSFCDITKDLDSPFGGKVMVFGGDFRQVLPVIPKATQTEIENSCLKNSDLWAFVRTIELRENMRVKLCSENRWFPEFLLRVGEGKEAQFSSELIQDYIKIPESLIFKPFVVFNDSNKFYQERELIRKIYTNIEFESLAPEFLTERTILTPLNDDVNILNDLATEMLLGMDIVEYTGQDSVNPTEGRQDNVYPTEYLNSLNPSGLPPYKLRLKVGQPIMLLRNLDSKKGLCNGTRLLILKLEKYSVLAVIMVGQFKGEIVRLPRVPLDTTDDGLSPVAFRRRQFPLRPAFAMTINKSQGQTLQHVGLYLPRPVFSHGQLYVALSRCVDPRNLHVLIKDGELPGHEGQYTRNVVFTRIFQM